MGKMFAVLIVGAAVSGGLYLTWGGAEDSASAAKEQAEGMVANLYGEAPGEQIVQIPPNSSGQVALQQSPGQVAALLPAITNSNQEKYMKATLHTNQGDITIEFMGNDAPNTVANFTKLAKDGFYNGTKFHRVIEGFMIQGGDPLTKDNSMADRWGTGDPGYKFGDEIHANNKNDIGTISMANSGPNTNGSQFFINTANNNFLDGKHTVFGRVIAGMETVKKIESTETAGPDRPVEAMVIESVTLE